MSDDFEKELQIAQERIKELDEENSKLSNEG